MPKWKVSRDGPQWLMDSDGRVVGIKDDRGSEWHIPMVQAAAGASEALSTPIAGTPSSGGGSGTGGYVTTTSLTSASRDAALTDIGNVVQSSSASPRVLTIRLDAVTLWDRTTGNPVFGLRQLGTGAVTWAAEAGVTINNPLALVLVQNGPEVMFEEVAPNTWNVS